MKKLLFFAALVLGMTSCQTEPEALDVVVGGEQDVNITVALPEGTRADSAQGFDLTNLGEYSIRYILEISYNNHVVRDVQISKEKSVKFPVRLAPGRNYTFTVWADLVTATSVDKAEWYNTDLYYNTENGLSNITFKEWTPNVEARDAYTFTDTFEFGKNPEKLKMTLTRPFAKVRVVATDIADVTKFGITPNKANITYRVPMYTAFNAVNGTVAGSATTIPSIAYNIVADAYTENTNELTVFADYIFVPADGTVKFDLVINDGDAKIKENSFSTAIPVEKNKVTSIVGNVLTEGGDVSIKIENELGQKETINYVDTAEDLQEIINNSEENESVNITLGGDIDLGALAGILSTRAHATAGLVIPANKTIVLDLKGYTISQSVDCSASYSMIANNGNLTITGEGTIEFTNTAEGGGSTWGTYTIENRGEGVLTIDNATIRHNGCVNGEINHDTNIAIQNYQGKVVVNNGTIASTQFRSLRDFTAGGEIIINGGTFLGQVWMQGLGNGSSSLTINGGNFTPVAGYDGSSVYITNNTNVVNVAITGGMFNTKVGCFDANKEGAKGCIVGGSFTATAKENTAAALINDDYAWVEAENGLWTVARKPVIAKIGETEYRVLQKAFDDVDNGTIVLQDDITLNAPAVLAAGKTATLNLNGKEIVNANASKNYGESEGIVVYGNLTIEGEGTIQGASMAVWARGGNGDAVINIKGGTFKGCQEGLAEGGRAVIYASSNNTVNIYGGEFKALAADKTSFAASQYPVLNVADNKGMINVYGGRFHNQNPAAPGTEPAAWNEAHPYGFVAEGYGATEENGVWTVKMTEEAKLRKVLAEGGEVTLEEDITIAAQLEVTTTEAIVVNGNNKTITYTGSDRAFNVNGLDTANVTLKNLTFVSEKYNQRCINFNVAGKLTLNNVTVGKTGTPATYAINLPGSSDGAEVVINNSYFRGNIALNVWGENVTINATGSEFVSYDGTEAENYAAISLNNDGSTIANGTTIYIDGGKVIALDEKGEPSYAVRNSTMTGVVTISDSTEVVGTVSNPVAAVIYEGYYEFYSCTTLKAAIDKAIETKGSVRLIKDIEVDETITIPAKGNVTIDLNGHNITSNIAGKPSEGFELFSVNGELEIKGNGTISLTSEDFEWNTSYRYTAINIRETGVVTLGNGVRVICEASKDGSYGMSYAVDIYTTGTLNINGASLHSNYIAVRCFYGNSVVNVNSGSKITSSKNNYGIWLQNSPGAVVTIADDVNYTFENNIYYFN